MIPDVGGHYQTKSNYTSIGFEQRQYPCRTKLFMKSIYMKITASS